MAKDIHNDKVEISILMLLETKRAFRALLRNKKSYIYKSLNDDNVFEAMKELKQLYKNYFGHELIL
jgi:hypothetical protein